MRSGVVCTLQQTLTSEAASILKHSLLLAKRRGHAQLTPLHVAATLLTLRTSSLKTACLKSQPNPSSSSSYHLQCRALELCFNVALNRLPTSPNGTTLLLSQQQPSLSNALIAALKRAQAHQRRGCIEQQHQQQPLLSIKVELDQLIISILDDPSVSRVMREAGFSSTAVKNNIEDSSPPPSLFHSSLFSSPSLISENHNPLLFFSPHKKLVPVYPTTVVESYSQSSSKEDVKVVLDVFLRSKKKKNVVIVGDSVSLTEGVVGELVGKFERGEVPDEVKSTQFIKFQLASSVSLRFMKRDEVEMNILQLKRKVDSIGRGTILYVGDLKWTVVDEKEEVGEVYNPVEHIVGEIGKLFCGDNSNNNKVWVLGTASYQTYMRCQMRQPSLETQWGLQAVPVPSGGGLGLTLHANSSVQDSKMMISQNPSPIMESKLFGNKEEQDKLNCCEECASNYEKEAQLFQPGQKKLFPSWLQSHSTDPHPKDELTQLKKKWNRLCHCLHQNKQPQNQWSNQTSNNAKIYPYNSSYPWWPNQAPTTNIFQDSSSITFAESIVKPAYSSNNVPRFRRQQSSTIEFNFNDVTQKKQPTTTTTTLDSLKVMEGNNKEVTVTLALGNSTFSGSGQKKVEKNITDCNRTLVLAHICKLLQENVPWQSETLSSIAEALVAKESSSSSAPTWLFLQGNDSIGKTRLALAIAESVFGSVDMLLHLDFLKRENSKTPFSEMLAKAFTNHEKIVLLVENVDFADTQFRKLLADGFETAKFATLKDEKNCQAIFILTNGSSTENNEEYQKKNSVMKLVLQISETKPNFDSSYSSSTCLSHKRSAEAELDFFTKMKNPRIEEKEDFSRKSSFNTLDLNMKADEEEDDDDVEEENNSPISSDLTRETTIVDIDSIENKFEFNKSSIKMKEMKEMFLSRMKESFEEVIEVGRKFNVEERVIEEIVGGCGYFTNSMFEKWLKDIFQRSLVQTFRCSGGGKEGIVFTLCWGGKEYTKWDSNGFMGTCLPKNVQVV